MDKQDGSFWVDEDNQELVLVEDDREQRFYIENKLEVENKKYLILIPSEEGEYDENEALVLRLEKSEEGEVLSVIEDDEEFEKVKKAYMEM